MFLIESGLVKLLRTGKNGGQFIISIVSSDALVGDEALGQHEYLTDVTCLTDVTGHYIPLETVKRLLGVPEMATALRNYAVVRDLDRINRIEMLIRHDVEHRILHSLAELAYLVKPLTGGASFPIPVTQLEIAIFVGATRETTSTILSSLQDRKLVTLSRRLVTTVDPDLLIEAASNRYRNAPKAQRRESRNAIVETVSASTSA